PPAVLGKPMLPDELVLLRRGRLVVAPRIPIVCHHLPLPDQLLCVRVRRPVQLDCHGQQPPSAARTDLLIALLRGTPGAVSSEARRVSARRTPSAGRAPRPTAWRCCRATRAPAETAAGAAPTRARVRGGCCGRARRPPTPGGA